MARRGRPALFSARARGDRRPWRPAEVDQGAWPGPRRGAALQGAWIAGYVAYEAGYALEPKLARLMPRRRPGPLLALWGLRRLRSSDADAMLDRAAD